MTLNIFYFVAFTLFAAANMGTHTRHRIDVALSVLIVLGLVTLLTHGAFVTSLFWLAVAITNFIIPMSGCIRSVRDPTAQGAKLTYLTIILAQIIGTITVISYGFLPMLWQ